MDLQTQKKGEETTFQMTHQTKTTVKHQLVQRENDVRCTYVVASNARGQKTRSAAHLSGIERASKQKRKRIKRDKTLMCF